MQGRRRLWLYRCEPGVWLCLAASGAGQTQAVVIIPISEPGVWLCPAASGAGQTQAVVIIPISDPGVWLCPAASGAGRRGRCDGMPDPAQERPGRTAEPQVLGGHQPLPDHQPGGLQLQLQVQTALRTGRGQALPRRQEKREKVIRLTRIYMQNIYAAHAEYIYIYIYVLFNELMTSYRLYSSVSENFTTAVCAVFEIMDRPWVVYMHC